MECPFCEGERVVYADDGEILDCYACDATGELTDEYGDE